MIRKKADVPMPRSKFLEVECRKCKEKSIVFNKAATKIVCDKCGEELALPTGGYTLVLGKVLRVLE